MATCPECGVFKGHMGDCSLKPEPTTKVAKSSGRGSKPGERRGGRVKGTPNKATASIRDIAGQYTAEAVEALVSVLRGGEGIPHAAQVSAAKEILDRAHGKATTIVAGEGEGGAVIVEIARRIIK